MPGVSQPGLNLWFPAGMGGCGIGDYIQIISAVYARMLKTGERVTFYYQWHRTAPVLFGIPGVRYVRSELPPDLEFLNPHDYYGPRNLWWEALGLDFRSPEKRLFYFPFPDEVERAEAFWGNASPRIAIQHRGGMWHKRWGYGPHLAKWAASRGARVALLDATADLAPDAFPESVSLVRRMPSIRDALAIVATADLFVGFDSGPFYAALGTMVPSIGVFVYECHQPEDLYYPIVGPKNVAYCEGPDRIDPGMLARDVEDLLGWNHRNDFSVGRRVHRCGCLLEGHLEDVLSFYPTYVFHAGETDVSRWPFRGRVFLDIYAGSGAASIWALRFGARVLAVCEADAGRLERNLRFNCPGGPFSVVREPDPDEVGDLKLLRIRCPGHELRVLLKYLPLVRRRRAGVLAEVKDARLSGSFSEILQGYRVDRLEVDNTTLLHCYPRRR